MAILKFNQNELVNLEYSLEREFLSTNRAGGYMCSTITCCNTRKYHGLMVTPIVEGSEDNYLLLSSLDETIIQHSQRFNLALHKFPNSYEPKGHKYITNFSYTPTPSITYRVGGVEIKKELLWLHSCSRLLIRYTLLEATSPTKLQLRPFLAFRNIHTLCKANMFASGLSYPVSGGVKCTPYADMPTLYMQLNGANEFLPAPDWYYDFEYREEALRGYHSHEDLLSPGLFEMDITKGQSIIISCSLTEVDSSTLEADFENELKRRSEKIEFKPCLQHSGRQFFIRNGSNVNILAGYPWFMSRGRDSFISLPGIALTQNNIDDAVAVLDGMVSRMKEGLFESLPSDYTSSADTSLWFFYTLQQLEEHTSKEFVWERYSEPMKQVIEAYTFDTLNRGITMHDNALIWASRERTALSWMDAYVDGMPVTPRDGYQVEVNSLWYNAVSYTLDMAKEFCDKDTVDKWEGMPERIKESFLKTFTLKEGYLADFVNEAEQNNLIRPNQLVACSLRYKMVDELQMAKILEIVERYLVTPKGIRSLAPNAAQYEGVYDNDEISRNYALHQGTIWPWMLVLYLKTKFDLYGSDFAADATEIIKSFEEDFLEYGIGTVAELYDGNPPYKPKGAISFAMSVGAVLRMLELTEKFSKKE